MLVHAPRSLAICLLAIACACTCGCVPILPHHDFVPEMAGRKLLRDRCWGNPSVETRADGITLTGWMASWPDDKPKVALQFDVPAGITVELLTAELMVASPPSAPARPARIPGISPSGNPSLPFNALGPVLKINDREVTIPKISFTREARLQLIAPLQC